MSQEPFVNYNKFSTVVNVAEKKPLIDKGALAHQLRAEYDDAERARSMVNMRWLEDLQQYRGVYGDDVTRRLNKSRRSRVYYRMTTAKVNTMVARLMDLLFPQRTKNWSIDPTPDPELPDEIIYNELSEEIAARTNEMLSAKIQELAAQGITPDNLAVQKFQTRFSQQAFQQLNTPSVRIRIAKDRAAAMERAINDQLKEHSVNGQRRPSWQQNCRDVVKSACLYGMGILKGPLVERVAIKKYVSAAGGWQEATVAETLRPYHEAVSVWDVFPDPGARLPSELRYVWQSHMMTDKDLLELAGFPGFHGDVIKEYIRRNPDGDATLHEWETMIRDLNADNSGVGASTALKNRYRVYERWGYLSGRELASAGATVGEDRKETIYPATVWLLGDTIIKAMVNPLDGVDIPYFFYPYQQDDSSFWPEGIAYQLRAPQAGINAAVRAMQDNVAMSSGPIYGVNLSALSQEDDVLDMQANKVWLFDKAGVNITQAFQAVTVPSCIEHNLSLASFWQNGADEVSTPRFNAGDGNVKGAGETASGLSMLMGAANILLKDHIKDFDDCIVSPFIRAMFRWNMRWNEDDSIKGDYEVVASGSQSLIAKEVRAQQIPALINYMGIPAFMPLIRAEKLLEIALEQTDLPVERILRTEDEAKQYQEEQMQSQAAANVNALVEELSRQGMPPEQIQQQMIMLLAQMQQGQGVMTAMPNPAQQPQQAAMQ